MKVLYTEDNKTLEKEWKKPSMFTAGKNNIVKMVVLPKVSYRCSVIL